MNDHPEGDVLELLVEDHAAVEALFARFERRAAEVPNPNLDVVRDITRELSVHAAVEEQVLYPLMREALPGGGELADHGIEEHQEIKERLAAIEALDPADEAWAREVMALIADVRHHVREEEDEQFPRLRAAVPSDRLTELARTVDRAKAVAPTRPHPRAPSTPPANRVVGPVAGLIDRVRDGARQAVEEADERDD
ncbi:MAG TPA: hemerythrin domain-containing protein [Actinomycetota bacterium]|nr:hemerythrin domain-containing protein [Actinomycetota bacterium]